MALINELLGSLKNEKKETPEEKPVTQLSRKSSRGRVSVFTSGKGGVGKSTIASAVAGFLAKEGKKPLLIDTDTGLRTLDVMMGIENAVTSNLYDAIEGRVEWQKALVTRPDMPNLYVLASDQNRNKESIRKDGFEKFLMNASRYFDNVIIDCPAGIEYGFTLAVGSADEADVVCIPEAPSLRGGAQVVRLLEQRKISPVSAILTRQVKKLEKNGLAPSLDEAEDSLGVPVRACIPMDLTIMACNHKSIPISLWNRPSPAVDAIWHFVRDTWLTPDAIWGVESAEGVESQSPSSRISAIRRSLGAEAAKAQVQDAGAAEQTEPGIKKTQAEVFPC